MFHARDKCRLTGLKRRSDLNGQVVTLSKWNDKDERWDARCHDGEGIRVREINLIPIKENAGKDDTAVQKLYLRDYPYALPESLADLLNTMVRGGKDAWFQERFPFACNGQISSFVFTQFAKLALEMLQTPTCIPDGMTQNSLLVAMLVNYVGKEEDHLLVFEGLKAKCLKAFDYINNLGGINLPLPSPLLKMLNMDSAEDYTHLMFNLRKGTLAFIENHQSMLRNIVKELKGSTLKSNRREPNTVRRMLLIGKDDAKSLKCSSLREELFYAARGGEVVVVKHGRKKVEVDPLFHNSYIEWLFQDVLHTLEKSDAKEGSLGEWHRLSSWEKHLTKSMEVSDARITLDVSNDFDLTTWLEGFVSFNLADLSDAPGVDTDRRILRLAFFAELAWRYSLNSGAWDRKRQENESVSLASTENDAFDDGNLKSADESPASSAMTTTASTSTSLTENEETDSRPFRTGTRVIVIGLEEGTSPRVQNGMEGKVLDQDAQDRYVVEFRNLANPQILCRSNLKRAHKPSPEEHKCEKCDNCAKSFCSRCSMAWYCSAKCQKEDYPYHKRVCKLFASNCPMQEYLEQAMSEASVSEIDDA